MAFAYDAPDDPDMDPAAGEAMPENQLEEASQPANPHEKLIKWSDPKQSINIADDLEPELLGAIGMRVVREHELDAGTRSTWMEQTRQAIDLAMQVAKEKNYPWPKAANVIFPLMTNASIQFAARAYPAIVAGRNVVKGVVVGMDPDGQKRARADRLGEHMSWQLLEEQPEWEPETDQLLHILPIVGCVFRKSYFDSGKRRNCSHMVPAQNLVISYYAKSLELAPRVTEELKLYPLEIEEKQRAGIFIEQEYGAAQPDSTDNKVDVTNDDDAPHTFLEQHRYLDLDEDGYPEPYVVTVHKATSKVARIVARYDADGVQIAPDGRVMKIEPIHYYTKYDFIPNPDGGIYGVGFGQILKPINEAVNSTLNQLLDAGHLANTSGGFVGKGLSMHTGDIRFRMGEYKTINATGAAIKDSIVPILFPGPSPVLLNLLSLLIDAGKEVASIKDVLSGDLNSQTMQPTTALAMIEQGLKVFTAIYKRVHRSLKSELEKLYRLNRVYMPPEADYRVGDDWRKIAIKDYQAGSGVEPISDPGMVSDLQRMGRAQFLQSLIELPTIQKVEATRRILEAAQMDAVDKLLVTEAPPPPPEVVAQGLELELRDREITSKEQLDRSTEAKNIAQAIQALSAAAAAGMQADMGWVNTQMDVWRLQLEAMNGGKPGAEGQGAGPSGVPGMEAPPMQPPPLGVPEGLQGPPPGGDAGGMAEGASQPLA